MNFPVEAIVASISATSAILIGLFVRRASKEQNSTTREVRLDTASDKLIENLQEDNKSIRDELKSIKENNSTLDLRVKSLERSRYAWKYWAQRVVPLLEGLGAQFPPTPERLEDTDPSMRGSN